ncbi:MAG: hypothetical protein QNJ92_07635 [Alphaproteobacteria bacterium]|nr:hypothetical protein [Alphaproteobacteria bacterium]
MIGLANFRTQSSARGAALGLAMLVGLAGATAADALAQNQGTPVLDRADATLEQIRFLDEGPLAPGLWGIKEGASATYPISFRDVVAHFNQLNAETVIGYALADKAFDALYGGAAPVRGEMRMVASEETHAADVVAYLSGAQTSEGDSVLQAPDRFVDASLAAGTGFTIYLQRVDTGEAVAATSDWPKLGFDPQTRPTITQLLDSGAFKEAIVVTEVENYKFPDS